MNQQLDTAYDLIKNGNKQEALDIIEPMIRADRDNEDAWWLLANATSDNDAKRNALNNVLRLTENDSRREKAQRLLQALNDDPYDFDVAPTGSPKMGAYQAIDEAPQKKGGLSCASISLIIVGLVGVCAVISVFGIFALAGDIFSFVNAPENYVDGGTLQVGESYAGTLSDEEPTIGYTFTATQGDEITLTIESEGSTAPFIVVYELNTGQVVTGANGLRGAFYQPQTYNNTLTATFTAPESGEYLVTIRGTNIVSEQIGIGDYTLRVE